MLAFVLTKQNIRIVWFGLRESMLIAGLSNKKQGDDWTKFTSHNGLANVLYTA